ncbi:carbonic anhydrase [Nocardioides sp. SYSU D00038]|uniref:beta-class carbonic anhydrase n=1 Tax=Nocardioides sp. SYSU D00038 TaxID=2812554 RepID=UPI001967304C|nr:carbonic anhydrase [Nocardioides sp. SYSU D00038]
MPDTDFDDLLAANAEYAETFVPTGLSGRARAGVLIVTCMDSRIEPLRMLGLDLGDAKILRNPGGRVTEHTMEGIILGVNLLNVSRVLIVEHTKCAVASNTEEELRAAVEEASGVDASGQHFPSVGDQYARLEQDVAAVRANPFVGGAVRVGGFVYDVDTGRLDRKI